jgi:hypothetical protein
MDLIFNNHIVKVINRDSEPFFYGSELAKMLNYARPGNALENHVSEENKIKVQSLDPGLRVLINEIGVYELIFSSNLPQAKEFRNFVFKVILPNFRKQLIPDHKLIGNQFVIKNEMDLHQKVVAYIRKYYPDVMINASLGENQDTSEKRIISYKAGYNKGSPDLNIMEMNSKYNGFFIEFKSPTLKGVLSPSQKQNLERLTLRGYFCYLSDDYDDVIKEINNYMMTRRIKCQYCKRKFKNENTLQNHKIYFHKIIN